MDKPRLFLNPLFTIDCFCHAFMCDHGHYIFNENAYDFDYYALDVNLLSLKFTQHFELAHPLGIEELVTICHNSGIGINLFPASQKTRGYNFSYGENLYIFLKENDSPTGHIHTLLHELYEIIDRILISYSRSLQKRQRKALETRADQFSAFVHAPNETVLEWIHSHGLDVFGLKNRLKCSYATALIRMNEVLCTLREARNALPAPVIGLLYERPYWEIIPDGSTPDFQLNSYVKSKGFPFALRRNEVDDLYFFAQDIGPITLSQFVTVYSESGDDVLFTNLEMACKGSRMTVDMLIRMVTWRNFQYPAKMLFQVIPSKHDHLRNLANKLNIAYYYQEV